jgi:hypothetical protein
MTTAQIKVGDVLIREKDHRADSRVTVSEIRKQGTRMFKLDGHWSSNWQRAASLCAEGYGIVERNGERIGTFFVKYW